MLYKEIITVWTVALLALDSRSDSL